MHALKQFAQGFRLHFEAFGFLAHERRLWPLATIPLFLSVLCFALLILVWIHYAGVLYAFATAWLPELTAGAWYTWLWIGPGHFLLFLLGIAAFLGLLGLSMAAAYLLTGLLAAPFLDVLSRRIEERVRGSSAKTAAGGALRDALHALREEAVRCSFFFGAQGLLFLAGALIPGAQIVTPAAALFLTLLFLPLDYASYLLDRHQVRFRERWHWVWNHPSLMLGCGLGAFLTCLIPGLNFAAMPLLVTSGTLLALRYPPQGTEPQTHAEVKLSGNLSAPNAPSQTTRSSATPY